MKGTAKSKVVTSGRLAGGVKVHPARRRASPNQAPASRPEPAYSLYSTDSEDQVSSLHKGLDRCAALLSGILQAENAEATPSLPRAPKGGAARPRPATKLGKKTIKKPPIRTAPDQKSQSVQRGPGSKTPRTTPQSAAPAAPQKQPHTQLQSHLPPPHSQTLQQPSPRNPPPQPHILNPPSQTSSSAPQTSIPSPHPTSHPDQLPPPQTNPRSSPEAPHTPHNVDCDNDETEIVPVRDVNPQSAAPHTHTSTLKMSHVQLEPDGVAQDAHTREDGSTEARVKTAQYLLGELKAGQGSAAERLLSHLEQTVSSPLMNGGGSDVQTEPDPSSLLSQNTQLRRRVRTLQQQLKERERAERQQNMDTLCDSQAATLQEELAAAQSQLQELQCDLTELRKALQDTQSRLRDREAENELLKTDLEDARNRLLDSEREKSELASIGQKRLEEIQNLNRNLQSRDSSDCSTLIDSSASEAPPTKQHQRRPDPAEPPTDRIAQYLMSLGQLGPTHPEHVRVAAEKDGSALTSVQHPGVGSQRGDKPASVRRHLDHCSLEKKLFNSTLSQCDGESSWSGWSAMSESTFDTRDEAAFRDGLAALDASIASLQRTIQLDLGR